MAQKLEIGIGAEISGLTDGLKKATGQIDSFAKNISSLGQKMTVGLTLPLAGLGAAAIKSFGDIEQLGKGLQATMKDAGLAGAEMKRLEEVAKLPGLGMQEAVKGSIRLQSIGISADKSRNILQQFGNAVSAAGGGLPEFERAIYGVQQLANTDFPLGEDLNIIKDALPQVSNLLTEAFGANRSDELAKMGVTSQQVLDTIIGGLEKLPRVEGGINSAFENMRDSVNKSLSSIGSAIDKTFDISGTITTLSDVLANLASSFENLSPGMQKTIVIIGGVTAAIGPLMVAVGGLLTALPSMSSGFALASASVAKLGGAMGLLLNPVTLAVAGIGLAVTAILAYNNATEHSKDRTSNWAKALSDANVQAQEQIAKLDALYQKTQNVNLSTKERTAAVAELQSQFPNYFGNLNREVILNGQSEASYLKLRNAIYAAARAKAAQGELEKREAIRLRELQRLQSEYDRYQAQAKNPKGRQEVNIGSTGAVVNFTTTQQAQEIAVANMNRITKTREDLRAQWEKEDKLLISTISAGANAQVETITAGGNESVKAIKAVTGKIANVIKSEEKKIAFTPNIIVRPTFDAIPAIEGIKSITDQLVNQSRAAAAKWAEELDAQFNAAQEQEANWNQLGQNLMESSIFNIGASIGEALADGANWIQVGGAALLDGIGQFAQLLGKEIIKLGLESQALGSLLAAIKSAIKNPYVLIAAGVAAVAIGSALTRAASKSMSRINGGGGIGGGSYPGGGSISTRTQTGTPQYQATYSNSNSGGFNGTVVFEIEGQKLVGVLSNTLQRNRRLGGQFEL